MTGRVTETTELQNLTEGQVVDSVELSLAEAAALNSTGLVTAQPSAHGWRVAAEHRVGVASCGRLRVRVHPNVGVVQVLRLLARAHGIGGLTIADSLVDVEAEPDITAVLAVLFAEEALTAMAAGPLRGYRTEDQTASVLRGRIRLREQALRRFGMLVPIEVTVDEWTADTTENRRIRAATRRLLMVPGLPSTTQVRLRRLDHALAEVWNPPRGAPLPPWQSTRLNVRLHRLMLLADLVLDQVGIEHRIGDVDVHGYRLSMSWLFERLVTQVLSETDSAVIAKAQPTYPLDDDARLTIQPDLVFVRDGVVVAVADVKYKLVGVAATVPNPDVYQLIAYCTRLGVDTGHLIYSAATPSSYRFTEAGITLRVHAVDLSAPVEAIESRLRGIRTTLEQAAIPV